MFINLWDRPVICKAAIAFAVLTTPALAFDNHPPLRDDGARWAASDMPTAMPRPTEDQGIDIVALGVLSEAELTQQHGFAGHEIRLSTVTLAPGGQVSALGVIAFSPGFIVVTGGEWTEGAPGRERLHTSIVAPTLTTGPQTRWFFNRGATPAAGLLIEFVSNTDLDVEG